VLTLLPTLVQDFAVFKTAVEGAILVVIFLAMPEGLFGRVAIWLDRGAVRMPRLRTGVAP
jgi:hypothetical protein